MKWMPCSIECTCTICALSLSALLAPLHAAESGPTFPTPEAAIQALAVACEITDRDAVRQLFGLNADDLVPADEVQATNELTAFFAAFRQSHHLVRQDPAHRVLEVGPNLWPFPVPIVQRDNRWHFDGQAGKDELLNRRIGRNELATLQVMRAYVDAQREYAHLDRDSDEVLEYAQKLGSSPGHKDGLYWPPDLDGEISPFGPLVAQAQEAGYGMHVQGEPTTKEPFHGYYFKILTRQGKHPPGGKYNYIINDNMIGGFALIAWPAQYGESGLMTFIVNQQGRVYQKNLGPKTDKLGSALTAYDPDQSWTVSPD